MGIWSLFQPFLIVWPLHGTFNNNKCLVNEIIICKDFYNKLILCMEYISTTIPKTEIIKQSINLKGFGNTECYKIKIPENGTFISYNNN